jgi:hypothetical protein
MQSSGHKVVIQEVITLPRPTCTYADHSYPAYSEKQVKELLEKLGYLVKTRSDLGDN